jgi:ComF family protein
LLCGDAGEAGHDLCAACAEALPRNTPACPRCAQPLPFQTDLPCGQCQQHRPAFDRSFALFRYQEQGETGHLIKALKFHARYPYARLLGDLLADALLEQGSPLPELIIPVPLHPSRYRERGYNQALEIARTVSHRLHIPLDFSRCIRTKATETQTKLTATERRQNVKRAFAVVKPLPHQHIALLDDVMTSSSTANELAKVLRKAGATQIDVWVCARTQGNT